MRFKLPDWSFESRYELTDRKWSLVRPILPSKPRGVPRVDDRLVLNGVFWAT
jgi:transposase